jgi:hypothetical protein
MNNEIVLAVNELYWAEKRLRISYFPLFSDNAQVACWVTFFFDIRLLFSACPEMSHLLGPAAFSEELPSLRLCLYL